jgi:tetratricopeptide (TPR) repeat protein
MNKSIKSKKKHEDVMHTPTSWVKKVTDYYNDKQKVVNGVTTGILVVIVIILAYTLYYLPSRQEKAELAIWQAERYFAMDSLDLALNGGVAYNGVEYDGVLAVINDYGFTKTGNRAKFIAGICYLKLGEYDNAIKYLKKFKSKDMLVSVQALGSIGDAYMEKGEWDNAVKYYKKAVSKNSNDLITPSYLLRLGMLCEMQGKWADAVSYYETLQKEHPQSQEAMEIDKRIEFAKAKS